jgi:hypothetical protein
MTPLPTEKGLFDKLKEKLTGERNEEYTKARMEARRREAASRAH